MSEPMPVMLGCTCGSSGGHYPPCPFAPMPTPLLAVSPLTGWICPACGGGVAPMVQRCPCKPLVTLPGLWPQAGGITMPIITKDGG